MERSVQSNRKLRFVRLSIPAGLAMLFVVILLWASASSAPAIASPPTVQEATVLDNGSVITIGVAADLSGGFEWGGWPAANAVQLAISQTNAAGGVDIGGITYTLKVVTADSGCDATQGVTAANTLLNEGVVAVVGHSCSDAVSETQPLYSAAGVPMVSPAATEASLTEQGYTTTFRVIPRDDAGAVLMATYFRKWLGMDEIAIVELKDFWGNGPNAFEDVFTSYGGAITSRR
ncbi:MAG: branched-chain amino acid ABC transporter substrate-binding protein, partial [Chloroflexota bacterium]|nr:branched-chain amino acid ABC transporter substrate-binding protein [Chloroflexota bacterium]